MGTLLGTCAAGPERDLTESVRGAAYVAKRTRSRRQNRWAGAEIAGRRSSAHSTGSARQVLTAAVAVALWPRQWATHGWYPTFVPVVSIAPQRFSRSADPCRRFGRGSFWCARGAAIRRGGRSTAASGLSPVHRQCRLDGGVHRDDR